MKSLPFILALGLIVSCIGVFARIYMDISLSHAHLSDSQKRRNTELRYFHLIKQRGVPAWPLVVAISCIPLGIVIIFGAIVWNNHLRLR